MSSTPPVAPRKPSAFPVLHGRRRTDDYAWLKDENWQQVMRDPAVLRADIREYLEAENAYRDAALAPTQALRAALFDEFRGRIKEDDSSVPAKDGAWVYYHRYRAGGQHPVVCRRPVRNATRDSRPRRRGKRRWRPHRARRGRSGHCERCGHCRHCGRYGHRGHCGRYRRSGHRQRRRADPARRRRGSGRQELLPHRGPRPLVEPRAVRLECRRERLGVLTPCGSGTSRQGSRSTT